MIKIVSTQIQKEKSIKNVSKINSTASVTIAMNISRKDVAGEGTATLLHVRETVPVGEMRPSAPLQVTVPG